MCLLECVPCFRRCNLVSMRVFPTCWVTCLQLTCVWVNLWISWIKKISAKMTLMHILFHVIWLVPVDLSAINKLISYCSCFQAVRYPLVPRIHSWSGKWVTLNFKWFVWCLGQRKVNFSRFSETDELGFCLFNFIASNHCLLHNSSEVDISLTLKSCLSVISIQWCYTTLSSIAW